MAGLRVCFSAESLRLIHYDALEKWSRRPDSHRRKHELQSCAYVLSHADEDGWGRRTRTSTSRSVSRVRTGRVADYTMPHQGWYALPALPRAPPAYQAGALTE